MSTSTTKPTILSARDVRKTYRLGRVDVPVLKGVDIDVREGGWIAVLGASGSGKSTLMHLLGGLDRPDRTPKGSEPVISFRGTPISSYSQRALDEYRRSSVGFVFQFYHLLPELDVLQNVALGAMIRHGRLAYRGSGAPERARELLDAFGLSHRLRHRPRELSGGERQRVAIARALINDPPVLLADEPTGNLDQKTGHTILDAIAEVRDRTGLTIVMVTHDAQIAARADAIVHLADGRVSESQLDPISGGS